MHNQPSDEDSTRAYRNDLAEVVKPRRPVAKGNRTERPSESDVAPLKLVAEQRVDTGAASDSPPITPRRVANLSDDDLDAAQDTGFADFAAERGAATLPDILEAAASYLTFVERVEEFSRPQLMSRVRQAARDPFSREDGLRFFGQLLRSGKIVKVGGGRFTASEDIDFQPDERAVG